MCSVIMFSVSIWWLCGGWDNLVKLGCDCVCVMIGCEEVVIGVGVIKVRVGFKGVMRFGFNM